MRTYKPHVLLWISVCILLVLGFIHRDTFIDIQWNDTYFVLDSVTVTLVLSIYLLCIGSIYWALRKRKISKWVTWIHLILTWLFILYFLIYHWYIIHVVYNQFDLIKDVVLILKYVFIFCVAAQFLFLGNAIFLIAKGKRN